VAAAQRFVSQLPTPAGAVRDPYSTACLAANTNLCLTSTTRSPDALFHDVVGQLGARGAAVKSEACGKPVDVIARCLADVRFSGVQLVVTGNATAGAKAALGVLVNDPNVQPNTTVAMGSWASLGIVPEGWRGTATCVSEAVDGCVRYSATLSGTGSLAAAGKAFQTSLSAANFRVLSTAGCPASGSDRCLVRAVSQSWFAALMSLVKQSRCRRALLAAATGCRVCFPAAPDAAFAGPLQRSRGPFRASIPRTSCTPRPTIRDHGGTALL
jgi:hypothetical protein